METNQRQSEQENFENSTGTGAKENYLLYNEELQGTPFKVVGNEEGYFIAFGRNRVSDKVKTPEAAADLVNTNLWEIMVNIIIVVIDAHERMKQDEEAEAFRDVR